MDDAPASIEYDSSCRHVASLKFSIPSALMSGSARSNSILTASTRLLLEISESSPDGSGFHIHATPSFKSWHFFRLSKRLGWNSRVGASEYLSNPVRCWIHQMAIHHELVPFAEPCSPRGPHGACVWCSWRNQESNCSRLAVTNPALLFELLFCYFALCDVQLDPDVAVAEEV